MKKDPLIYLDDILFSIGLVEKYITEVKYEEFKSSYDIQDKVLRRLEIIAEASKGLPEDVRALDSSIPWKSIIGLRNIIAHVYDEVNLEEIWIIVSKHLPGTKKQIESLRATLVNK